MNTLKLLYLGFALPPGAQEVYPHINPAGQMFETEMLKALSRHFDIRSAGTLPFEPILPAPSVPAADGLNHELILVEQKPDWLHHWRSVVRLRRALKEWQTAGWQPDVLLAYNLWPAYYQFCRWLKAKPRHPHLCLLLADSASLGQAPGKWKKFRRRFQPWRLTDDEAIEAFESCIALSKATEEFFAGRKVPWLWMPGGCTPDETTLENPPLSAGEIRFGYFGGLAPHTGIVPLIENFLSQPLSNTLHICGHGKLTEKVRELCGQSNRLQFHGLLPAPADCLAFARQCDVLVNPRPLGWGNENNFPSKIFQYALSGRAILSSRLSGVDAVLGEDAFYFDAYDFAASLKAAFTSLARMTRATLHQRGATMREQVLSHFTWKQQAARMMEFLCTTIKPAIKKHS